MNSFDSLYKLLNESGMKEVKLTFEQLENILGTLPKESEYRNWWANDSSHEYSKAWCSAGYNVVKVVPYGYVCFNRIKTDNFYKNLSAPHNQAAYDAIYKRKDKSIGICIAIMVLDSIICIPLILKFFMENNYNGMIFSFIAWLLFIVTPACLLRSSLPSGPSNYSSGYGEISSELKSHNAQVRQMMRDSENSRVRENFNKIIRENETSLADKLDTRITNIFKNPFDGIL